MEKVVDPQFTFPFNGTLETGVRAVVVLYTSYPTLMDIQRLTAMDYLLVRTSVLGGPNDLHPKTPVMTPVTQVRRRAVYSALDLMMSRDLITQTATADGIMFAAGSTAALFFNSFRSRYLLDLIERAEWLANHLMTYSDRQFDDLMSTLFADWVAEFSDQDFYQSDLQ